MGAAPWLQENLDLKNAGFSDNEIGEEQARLHQEMMTAGFADKEINEYFGRNEPDMKPVREHFEANVQAHHERKRLETNPEPRAADGFIESLEAGWQLSVSGLMKRGKNPEIALPGDAGMMNRVASQAATLVGDMPAMIAGNLGGRLVGSAIGGSTGNPAAAYVGGTIGGNAGAFALPAGMRTYLMQSYEKGEVVDFKDWWERASAVSLESLKAGTIGAAVGTIGTVTSRVATPLSIPSRRALQYSAEVGTMVAVGSALEGEVPKAHEFIDAAMLVMGMHVAAKGATSGYGYVSSKMRTIYAKTGVKPHEVLEVANENPVVKQELLSDDGQIPFVFESMIEPGQIKATEAPLPVAEPVRIEPVKKILAQVAMKEAEPGKPWLNFRETYRNWFDRLDPINEATKEIGFDPKSLSTDQNPYKLARMANDYKAKTKHVIEHGTIDYNTLEKTGKGMKEIIEPFKNDMDELNAYLLSKRALDLNKRGIKSGFDLNAAAEVVEQLNLKYHKTATELHEFQTRNLRMLRDAGIISEKSYDKILSVNEFYVPLKRVMDPEGAPIPVKGKPGSLKKIVGAQDGTTTQPPILSILENTEAIMKIVETNRAKASLVDKAEFAGADEFIKKVKTPMKPVEIRTEEIAKFLKEQGLDESYAEAFTVFRPDNVRPLAPDEFQVYRGGKKEIYKTTPALAEAFKALDGDKVSMNMAFRLMRGITTAKKIGITLTPEFITKNFIRDQVTASTLSESGKASMLDTVVAIGDLVKKNDTYYNWLKSGGAGGSFMDLNRSYLMKDVFKLNTETGFMDKAWNVVKTPYEKTMLAGQLLEQATRLAEFKRVAAGETSGSKVMAGGYASREVTLDFSRMGAKIAALNQIIAFTNVGVQGIDRSVRAVKDNPWGTTKAAATFITGPSVLLWWAQKDDERYKEIPRWQKDLFWNIVTDDWQPATKEDQLGLMADHLKRKGPNGWEINKGTIYRIAKPQEFGVIFGSLPERVLEAFFTENPRAMKDFHETMVELATPSVIPDAISPFLEQKFNRSFFTDRRLIPGPLEKVAPELQYTEYTSETAKALGKVIQHVPGFDEPGSLASPIILDNYIRSWTGGVGGYLIQIADKGLQAAGIATPAPKPASTLADLPFIKAFVVRYPSYQAQSIQDFNDRFEKVEIKMNSLQQLAKNPWQLDERQQYFMKMHATDFMQLKGVRDAMNQGTQLIHMINLNPQMSREEKRQLIDGQYYQMIKMAREANKITDGFEQAMKAAEKSRK